MTELALYMYPVAPNPTRVRCYLAERRMRGGGIPVREVTVDLSKAEHRSEEHLARNPLGTLPVLGTPEGNICDSAAIIEYFEETHPDGALLGRTPFERAQQRVLEREADLGVMLPLTRWVHRTRSPLGLPARPEAAREAMDAAREPLLRMCARLGEQPFICGELPGVADATVAAGVQFSRMADTAALDEYPALLDWYERLKARGDYADVLAL